MYLELGVKSLGVLLRSLDRREEELSTSAAAKMGMFSDEAASLRVLVLEAVEVGLPSSSRDLIALLAAASLADILLVARAGMCASFLFTSLMSSGCENGITGDDDVVTVEAAGNKENTHREGRGKKQ